MACDDEEVVYPPAECGLLVAIDADVSLGIVYVGHQAVGLVEERVDLVKSLINSVDVVLLYDIFHDLSEPDKILAELHRVLKPRGILSFSDHHMREDEIVSKVTSGSLFKLSKTGERTFSFVKEG